MGSGGRPHKQMTRLVITRIVPKHGRDGQAVRAVGGVLQLEMEWVVAQLAVRAGPLGEPPLQTILVHELDAPLAFARVKQRSIRRGFAATNAARI